MTISPLAPAAFPDLPVIDGVTFAATTAGVKYANRLDVMLAIMADGTSVAGVFTTSATRSANVLDCQRKLAAPSNGPAAIIVNSGNSNAFTGKRGDGSVAALCKGVADVSGINEGRIFTASTGVIGEPLPHNKIIAKLQDLHDTQGSDRLGDAAQAIMTTDTFAKGSTKTVMINGAPVKIAGIAKGSGMIAPDMATMLVYIFTDAKIGQADLQTLVSRKNAVTFNCITVDSDTSTSDSLMIAATGTSGVDVTGNEPFETALHDLMRDLAHQVVRDGEGATKFVTINVTGAADDADARLVAMATANSPLVKTAIAGEDPNWGRIVMAVGKSGAAADRDLLSIRFGDTLVAENGWVAETYTEDAGAAYMKNQDITINLDLGLDQGAATAWTCDLTHGYITINADYRS